MADPELVRTIDYILNRCGEAEIEAVAAAVVRRKRDLSLFAGSGVSDPRRWAKDTARKVEGGVALDSIRSTVRSMAAEMLHREAPELDERQVDELLGAWTGGGPSGGGVSGGGGPGGGAERTAELPQDVLGAMVAQFVAFSTGRMGKSEDGALRAELGAWPDKYWKAFQAVVRSLISDLLAGRCPEDDFKRKMLAALELCSAKRK